MRKTLGFLLIVIAGCGPLTTQPKTPDDVTKPDVTIERATAADVWLSLANAVDRGTISTTERLAQFVLVLAKNGDLSIDDVKKFDAAFPNATKSTRATTKEDVATLKGIK